MKFKKLSPALFFIASVSIFTLCGILLFAMPQRTFSENENRYLNTFKKPAISDFLDTSMQKNFTDSANDQFIGRDFWMKCATAILHSIGFQDIGDVYFGKEGYYFERILNSHLSQSRYLNSLHHLEQFSETYDTKTYFLPVPSKGTILEKLLPEQAVLYDADQLYKQAAQNLKHTNLLDIRSLMMKSISDCQLYFKTDHHWTMHAAYLAYTAWCTTLDYKPVSLTTFTPTCADTNFLGTLYSKAPDFHIQSDLLYLPSHLPEAEILIDGKPVDSIYDRSKLDTKDKYGVYFGGNFGRIDIQVKNSTQDKTLVVIKDSFANSLVPFLMADYAHITMIDFRYYNLPVSKLLTELQPDETLILYEMSNFAQDPNFFKILK